MTNEARALEAEMKDTLMAATKTGVSKAAKPQVALYVCLRLSACTVYHTCCRQYIRFAPIAKSFKGAYLYNDIKKQSLLHFHISTVLESGAVTWAILQVCDS